MNIVHTMLALKQHIDTKNKVSWNTMDHMVQDAMCIPPKLATAMAAGRYDLQMKNASIVQKCTKQIMINADPFWGACQQIDEYLHLLQEEIDQFRMLLIEWVKNLSA